MAKSKVNPTIYPTDTPKHSKSISQAVLRLTGIEQLKAPGPELNYLDWEFVVDQFLQATKCSHVILNVPVTKQSDSWPQENIAVCLVITRTVSSANYCYIQPFRGNAFGMWDALKRAHQDSFFVWGTYVLDLQTHSIQDVFKQYRCSHRRDEHYCQET